MVAEDAAAATLHSIDYATLVGGTDDEATRATVAKAFGPDGLGVLAVVGVPAELTSKRIELLTLARKLGTLPTEELQRFERPELHYCAGWSRGREKFKGKVDTAKGSWYANGLYDDAAEGSTDLKERYPESTTEPIWPEPALLGGDLREAFRGLSKDLYDLSLYVLRHCDEIAEKKSASLAAVTHERSRLHVGRLLHYYPRPPAAAADAWCGWHNDNSIITALAPAIYFDDASGERVAAPPGAGLMACARSGARCRVPAPPQDSILFQIGEAAQVISGGALVATPHAVSPGELTGASRESFALFVEPGWDEPLSVPDGVTLEDVLRPDDNRADIIPPLRKRLKRVPVAFARFLSDSIQEYY